MQERANRIGPGRLWPRLRLASALVLGLTLGLVLGAAAPSALGQESPPKPAEPKPVAPKPADPPPKTPTAQVSTLTLPGTPVKREPRFGGQRQDLRGFHVLGKKLSIADRELTFQVSAKELRISGAVRTSLRVATTVKLSVGKGASKSALWLHFAPDPPPPHAAGDTASKTAATSATLPVWRVANITAQAFRVADHDVHIVDANLDGRYDGFGSDAFALPGSPMLIPLTRKLVLGRSLVEITSVDQTGRSAVMRATPIVGNARQLGALEQLNGYRWQMGLPPVMLDGELSKACEAHALYLERNNWSGYSSPHEEEPERPGYSKEGAHVAPRAIIMQARVRFALDSFWRSYYHRIDLMDPSLERIGMNAEPHWIVVVNARTGVSEYDVVDAGWNDPILCPANGAIDVPTRFCSRGEAPAPVRTPAVRGNPLMANFTMDDRIITKFTARLMRDTDAGRVQVELMTADQRHAAHVFGAIPRAPLAPDTTYRVTFSYEANGQPESKSATFRTAR